MIVRLEILEIQILPEMLSSGHWIEGIYANHISDAHHRCYGGFGLLENNESSRAGGNQN